MNRSTNDMKRSEKPISSMDTYDTLPSCLSQNPSKQTVESRTKGARVPWRASERPSGASLLFLRPLLFFSSLSQLHNYGAVINNNDEHRHSFPILIPIHLTFSFCCAFLLSSFRCWGPALRARVHRIEKYFLEELQFSYRLAREVLKTAWKPVECFWFLSYSDGRSVMIEQEPEVRGPWARAFSWNPASWYRWPRPHAPGLVDRQHCWGWENLLDLIWGHTTAGTALQVPRNGRQSLFLYSSLSCFFPLFASRRHLLLDQICHAD